MSYPLRTLPSDIWTYPTRELTQSKFPFWSAIITQTQGSVYIAASSSAAIVIQPPAGEIWCVNIAQRLASSASGSQARYNDYDGTTAREHAAHYNYDSYVSIDVHLTGITRILTNSLYAQLYFTNAEAASKTAVYGYSGFKLSQPLWAPKRLNDPNPMPWKKPTSLTLPLAIAPLQKYAFDILGIDPSKPNEYGLGVILEEDTPLAIDPVTNFPVERLTAVVKADVLADFIGKFKAKTADPIQTGYRKYLDKWKLEGIDFGV